MTLAEEVLVTNLNKPHSRVQEWSAVHQLLIQNGDPTDTLLRLKFCDSEQINLLVSFSILCARTLS